MNARERAVQLRSQGLILSAVSEVLNTEGYRMDRGGIFDKKGRGAWNYSTRKAGERCPRSGFWDTTCEHYQGGQIYYNIGQLFLDCPASCDYCKWEIIPTNDETIPQHSPEEEVLPNTNMDHANQDISENLTRQNASGLESAEARLNQRIDAIERLLKEDVALGVSCIYSMILNLGKRLGISEDDLLK